MRDFPSASQDQVRFRGSVSHELQLTLHPNVHPSSPYNFLHVSRLVTLPEESHRSILLTDLQRENQSLGMNEEAWFIDLVGNFYLQSQQPDQDELILSAQKAKVLG